MCLRGSPLQIPARNVIPDEIECPAMDQPLLVKARSVYALFGYRVGIHFAGEAFDGRYNASQPFFFRTYVFE